MMPHLAAVLTRHARPYSLRRLSRWELFLAVLTGCVAGIGLGLPVSHGNPGPLVIVALVIGALALVAGQLVPAPHRRTVYALVGLAFGVRLATAAVLYDVSVVMGRGGAIVGDDGAYADLAWSFVQWLRGIDISPDGPPDWSGQSYLFGTFVYLESLVFLLFGRQVLAVAFLNAGFAAGTLLLLFSLTRRLFGQRPALASLAVTAFYPSLVLWSALNLKDALVLLVAAAMHWLLPKLQLRPTLALLAILFLLAFAFESMRLYIYVVFLLIVPAAILIGRGRMRLPMRLGYAASAAALSAALLFSLLAPFITNPLHLLDTFEVVRQGLSTGARTGYVAPSSVVRVNEGDTFYVPVATGSTPDPSRPSPAIVFVAPDTRIVVVTASPAPSAAVVVPTPSASPPSPPPSNPASTPAQIVFVRPGDTIVVGVPGTTAAPEGERRRLALADERDGPSAQLAPIVPKEQERGLVLDRTLSHIPRGLAYALLAPFPWEIRRTADLATVPEMLVWYALVCLTIWSLWRNRRRWWQLMALVIYVAGLFVVFTLAEGNVGILYRHRSMIVPFVVVLASPGIIATWDAGRRYLARRRTTRR